jgi:hypothetical protein
MRMVRLLMLTLVLGVLASCGGGDEAPDPVFVFRLRDLPASEAFRVQGGSPQFVAAVRAQLALPQAQRRQFPNGRVVAGDGGHNAPWNWHLEDAELAEATIELCDARPSMVEADLPAWIGQRFCPWSAYVAEEL